MRPTVQWCVGQGEADCLMMRVGQGDAHCPMMCVGQGEADGGRGDEETDEDLELRLMKWLRSSIGSGNMTVEFFSADTVLSVWR